MHMSLWAEELSCKAAEGLAMSAQYKITTSKATNKQINLLVLFGTPYSDNG